jgi:hypothetical protein
MSIDIFKFLRGFSLSNGLNDSVCVLIIRVNGIDPVSAHRRRPERSEPGGSGGFSPRKNLFSPNLMLTYLN